MKSDWLSAGERVLIRTLLTIVVVQFTSTVTWGQAEAASAGQAVSFVNDVVPVLTKAGCNGGACHAKAGGGQKGFQLSLLGFETDDDYESLVLQGRGRRLFPAAPDQSLLLTKASGQVPHGGGVRLPVDSAGYAVLRQWIAQGMPLQRDGEQELVGLRIEPARGTVQRKSQQKLTAFAEYSDGSVRDVTEMALYEVNSEALGAVDEQGLISVNDLPGKLAVMVRYQGKIAVYTAAIPLGAPMESIPEPNNFIDTHVFANLQAIGVPPSPVCDDATFLRRVTLDVAGRLPTLAESEAFLASDAADKRSEAVESLLRSPYYADYFANKWTPLLKNRRDDASDITSNFAFHAWIRDSLLANVPFDQMVRELLAATGTVVANPPVAWYKRVSDPKEQLEDVAQLFLGVRMQCAQCHHHPFERWSQDDYYSLAAFFSQVGRKPTATRGEDLIFHKRGQATAVNVKSGEKLVPAALGDDVGVIPPGEDPRLRLADWMSSPTNPFFAKALVNRYWKHFFKVGLIEPEDDIRDTNPPTNPELLTALEQHFIQSKFDLKELVRVIVNSKSYQLSGKPNEFNGVDQQNFSHFYSRRLPAEVLLDSIDDLTGAKTTFANMPPGTRAIALPDNSYNRSSQFLQVFGRPNNSSVCECERVQSSSLSQSLHLINSAEIKGKLGTPQGRALQYAKADVSIEQNVTSLYLTAFARTPTAEEMQVAADYLTAVPTNEAGQPLEAAAALRQNWQDLVWVLVNTREFQFNH